jgi:hypothetical protein
LEVFLEVFLEEVFLEGFFEGFLATTFFAFLAPPVTFLEGFLEEVFLEGFLEEVFLEGDLLVVDFLVVDFFPFFFPPPCIELSGALTSSTVVGLGSEFFIINVELLTSSKSCFDIYLYYLTNILFFVITKIIYLNSFIYKKLIFKINHDN